MVISAALRAKLNAQTEAANNVVLVFMMLIPLGKRVGMGGTESIPRRSISYAFSVCLEHVLDADLSGFVVVSGFTGLYANGCPTKRVAA